MVERGSERKRSVSFEITEPAHEVLSVDRKPVPFDARVTRPQLVRRLVDCYPRRKCSSREGKHAVGIVQRSILGTGLIEIGKAVLPGSGKRCAEPNANFVGGEIIVVHVA